MAQQGCSVQVAQEEASDVTHPGSLSPTPDDLLSAMAASRCLGISPATLYDWLAQSDGGTLLVRGSPVTVAYFQGGPRGQGRIKLERREVERIKELMRVTPRPVRDRRPPVPQHHFPGIVVPLGRPKD